MQNKLMVRRAAMDLLSRREHTQKELVQKLARRFEDKDLIYQVLQELQQENLQSDQRFAEQYTRMRMQKGYGQLKLKLELQNKGVAVEIIEALLNPSEFDWQTVLLNEYRRKYGEQLPEDLSQKARCQRFLLSRGFSFTQLGWLWKHLSKA